MSENIETLVSGAEGAAIDPLTGDFLFSTFGGGNQVIVVQGFLDPCEIDPDLPECDGSGEPGPGPSVPEPTTLGLFGVGLAGLGFARRRRLHG